MSNGVLWEFAGDEKDGGKLMSFLKELAADKKFVHQIDRIFRSGDYRHPLVNWMSCNPMIEDEFNKLF